MKLAQMPNQAAQSSRGGLVLTGAMLTDPGLVRGANEDAVAYTIPCEGLAGEISALAVVADGMGGHSAGEIASGIATATIMDMLAGLADPLPAALAARFRVANAAILERAQDDPDCAGMGTTCTAIAFSGQQAFLAHIGDSRAYLLSERVFRQISEDHSLVAALLREGLITPAQAELHPDRNVILQALGTHPGIAPQISQDGFGLGAGDRLLLCSDGLSDLVDEATMVDAITRMTPAAACRRLLDAALLAGGIDNISVGVFAIDAAAPPTAATRDTRPVEIGQMGG